MKPALHSTQESHLCWGINRLTNLRKKKQAKYFMDNSHNTQLDLIKPINKTHQSPVAKKSGRRKKQESRRMQIHVALIQLCQTYMRNSQDQPSFSKATGNVFVTSKVAISLLQTSNSQFKQPFCIYLLETAILSKWLPPALHVSSQRLYNNRASVKGIH